MNIPLPSLPDILGWLLAQLKTWLAILIDTKSFAREMKHSVRANNDEAISGLAGFAIFIFLVDTMFYLPFDIFRLDVDALSPKVLFSGVALFCMQVVIYLASVQIALRAVARHRDLRVTLAFVLIAFAFYPLVHLAGAPIRVMFPKEAMEALYAADFGYFLHHGANQKLGLILKLAFVYAINIGVFVWCLKRSVLALSELHSLSLSRSVFVIGVAIVVSGFFDAILIGPLYLEIVRH